MSHPTAGHPDAIPFVAAIAGVLIVARSLVGWIWPPEGRWKRRIGPGPKPR